MHKNSYNLSLLGVSSVILLFCYSLYDTCFLVCLLCICIVYARPHCKKASTNELGFYRE